MDAHARSAALVARVAAILADVDPDGPDARIRADGMIEVATIADAAALARHTIACVVVGDERPLSREQGRSRRARPVRAKTISTRRLSKSALEEGRQLFPEETRSLRPRTRNDCVDGARPCPFVSCRHHLYLDVSPKTGAIKLNFPDIEPEDLKESCSLDVADRSSTPLEAVGRIMNVTRERVRQIETMSTSKVRRHLDVLGGFDALRPIDVGDKTPRI